MKWLLAMVSKGRDVSEFFSDVVKNMAVRSVEVKKMVYIYLVHYADNDAQCRELALLSINSFQNDLRGSNQVCVYVIGARKKVFENRFNKQRRDARATRPSILGTDEESGVTGLGLFYIFVCDPSALSSWHMSWTYDIFRSSSKRWRFG